MKLALAILATILLVVAASVFAVTASAATVVEYEVPPLHLAVTDVSEQVTQVAPEAYNLNYAKAATSVFTVVADVTGTIATAESAVDPYALTEVW